MRQSGVLDIDVACRNQRLRATVQMEIERGHTVLDAEGRLGGPPGERLV